MQINIKIYTYTIVQTMIICKAQKDNTPLQRNPCLKHSKESRKITFVNTQGGGLFVWLEKPELSV